MSSLFETNVARPGKVMARKGETMAAIEHEQASQAAFCHQNVGLAQPVSGLSHQNQACQWRSVPAVGLRKLPLGQCWERSWSGDPRSMGLPGLLKDRGLIGLLLLPERVKNARPDIGQGSDRDAMAFALGSFALIILPGPGFLKGTRPAKLVQGIAPGLDAAQTPMSFLVRPALKENRRGASEGLQAACALIAAAVIAHLRKPPRSETRACSGQSLEEFEVFMDQKKTLDFLVIVSNLLEKRFQLVYQSQHQPRFGARCDRVGLQARLLEMLDDASSSFPGPWILGLFQQGGQFLHRSRASGLQRRIGAQECERRRLLQLAEQCQHDWVVGYASGGKLVDQAGLHVDQRVLVARQGFEFLDLFTVGIEPTQILEISASRFRQHIGVNGVGLGSRGCSSSFDGTRIDRVNRPSHFQQVSNQPPMGGFHDTGELLTPPGAGHSFQIGIQLAQPESAVGNTDRFQLTALFVNAQRIMVLVCPINAAKLHSIAPYLRQSAFLNSCVLILWRAIRDSLMTSRVQKLCLGRTSFLNRSSRVEDIAFPRHVRQSIRASVLLALAPCRGGLVQF